MRDCVSVQSLILRSVDEAIDNAGARELAAHLEECEACRRTLAVQRAVKAALGDLPMAAVSADFAARVRERVAPSRWLDALNWRAWTIRLAPVAAVLLVLAALPLAWDSAEAQSPSGALDSWAASRVGVSGDGATAGAASTHMQILLNPEADPNALLAAALEGASR